jgi:hypothetical protein
VAFAERYGTEAIDTEACADGGAGEKTGSQTSPLLRCLWSWQMGQSLLLSGLPVEPSFVWSDAPSVSAVARALAV